MADIKKAANWMAAGRSVRREGWAYSVRVSKPSEDMTWNDDDSAMSLSCADILADDWELTD